MAATTQNTRRYLMSGALVVAIAVGAYGLGRVYPPLGPSAGTIAPADRYVSSQVGDGDVTLGDTSIPKLMQTDAFEVMSKNPNFKTLASHPGFAALAANSQAMSAIAANPNAFTGLAKSPAAFLATLDAAKAVSAAAGTANAGQAQAFSAIVNHPSAFSALGDHP